MRHDRDFVSAGHNAIPQRAMQNVVESALQQVKKRFETDRPRDRDDRDGWVRALCQALLSESEASHHAVISSLIASGVTMEEVHQVYVPAAARMLGEWWVNDDASFVDVTVASGRLQSLFRTRAAEDNADVVRPIDRTIPLGQSVLMTVPQFEQHSLGAFVAADNLRRHCIWVRMAIGLENRELRDIISDGGFSMIGLTASSWQSVERSAQLIDELRQETSGLPPVVIGGSAVDDTDHMARITGADYAVRSAREAVERCGLASVAEPVSIDGPG